MEDSITVIGAGNGGSAMAAYLAGCGAKINLCDPFPQYIEGIRKAGFIELSQYGKTSRHVMHMVTSDISAAISGVRLVLVVTPSFTHKIIAESCYEALSDGQIVVLNPGRTGGALDFLNAIRSKGCRKNVIVSEAQTLVYSCRKTSDNSVIIYGVKRVVDFGVCPVNSTNLVLEVLRPYYPQFQPVKSCLQTSLSNIGALFHPVPVLLNIGRIENDVRGYRYYWDGITPSVAILIKAIDDERMAIAAAYDTMIQSADEWLQTSYGISGDSLYDLIQQNAAYGDIKAPIDIESRYVTEDVPMSLVPLSELGKIANIPTPNMDAVISLTSAIYGRDFRKEGRSMQNLGLEGMDKTQVIHYFETGEK